MKNGQIQIHIMFKIRHFTKVQLNYEKVKIKICDELWLKNVYCYNPLVKSN